MAGAAGGPGKRHPGEYDHGAAQDAGGNFSWHVLVCDQADGCERAVREPCVGCV